MDEETRIPFPAAKPSPRGEGFVRRYSFSTYACICSENARKAVFSFRSLPHWGRGTALAVDRVLSLIVDLRRISSLSFIPLEPYPARFARHLPHAGKALSVVILFLHVSYIRFDDARKPAFSYRSLPHWGRFCRRKRYSRFFIRPTQKRPSLTSGRFYMYYLLRGTLIKSQNSISHVFLCNASSYSSLNSSLFASEYSLHCMKI